MQPDLLRFEHMKSGLMVFIVLGGAATASANLISDGSFENPSVPAGTFVNYVGGDTIGAWNVVGTEVSTVSSTYGEPANGIPDFNAEDGSVSLDLTGPGNNGLTSGVSQSFASTAGYGYLLKFWEGTAISDNGSPFYQADANLQLSVNNGPEVNCPNPYSTPGVVNWQYFLIGIRAKGPSTNLTFTNGSLYTDYVGLDNVTVTLNSTPEPAPFAVIGLGALGVLLRRRRRS